MKITHKPEINKTMTHVLSRRLNGVPVRRGNTLILVSAVLVLLVIVATGYITRTQAQRGTAVATQAASQRDDNTRVLADALAQELADHLFVWPIDRNLAEIYHGFAPNTLPDGYVVSANVPRRRPFAGAMRYGYESAFPYNAAPFHTVPVTNWPDWRLDLPAAFQYLGRLLPSGPGNLYDGPGFAGDGSGGQNMLTMASWLSSESNMLGNPGFGDFRALRDTEPMRWTLSSGLEGYSHYRKLSNIARANNGFRIVADISDVDRYVVSNLDLPVEQWLARKPGWFTGTTWNEPFNNVTGNVSFWNVDRGPSAPGFFNQWFQWFGLQANGNAQNPFLALESHLNAKLTNTPPNFYNLRDLNADGIIHNFEDRPEDEWIPGRARNMVSRVLADTTGDGFTDSFWFLSPLPVRDGLRQIVAVSIVDNSAMVNPNVATAFYRSTSDVSVNPAFRFKTRGLGPMDVALVGQRLNIANPDNPPPNWNTGFYDNPENSVGAFAGGSPHFLYRTNYNPARWTRHQSEVGLLIGGVPPANLRQEHRLDYWRESGRWGMRNNPSPRPFAYVIPGPTGNQQVHSRYTPFTLSDEIELRMYHGNNYAWNFTRFEWSVQDESADQNERFLRAALYGGDRRLESSEYLDQLDNRSLVRDRRRMITMYSGARNEQLAPGVRWYDAHGVAPRIIQQFAQLFDDAVYDRFREQSLLKLDLREPDFWYHQYFNGAIDYSLYTGREGYLNLRERLAPAILGALIDAPSNLFSWGNEDLFQTYYGPFAKTEFVLGLPPNDEFIFQFDAPQGPLNRTRRLAAGYAANLLAYRSNQPFTLRDRVPLPSFGHPGTVEAAFTDAQNYLETGQLTTGSSSEVSFLGIDPQPFLVEAFIAHVYKPSAIVPHTFWPGPVPDPNSFDCDSVPPNAGIPYDNAGQYVLLHDDGLPATVSVNDSNGNPQDRENPPGAATSHSAIIVVQIANPFDVPIDLHEYAIEVFGQRIELNDPALQLTGNQRFLFPATERNPVTLTLYAMKDNIFGASGGDDLPSKWLAFLDLETSGANGTAGTNDALPPGSIVRRVPAGLGANDGTWSVDRVRYDGFAVDENGVPEFNASGPVRDTLRPAVVISRRDTSLGADYFVVVDRMDPPQGSQRHFGNEVNNLADYRPVRYTIPLCAVPPVTGPGGENLYPAYTIDENQHWVQWVRATRAWGVDLNGNGLYESHERNPRFVFGDRAVVVSTSLGTPDTHDTFSRRRDRDMVNSEVGQVESSDLGSADGDAPGANIYAFQDDPNGSGGGLPWFTRKYYNSYGMLVNGLNPPGSPVPPRKPTFFASGWREVSAPGLPNAIDWGSFDNTDPLREYFAPDKGWYGQLTIDHDALGAGVNSNEQLIIRGAGWGAPREGAPFARSGVDDPTILAVNTEFLDSVSNLWNDNPRRLFRHPFSMKMTLKNKHFVNAENIDNIDFEQVGEVLNVWLFGHEIEISGGAYSSTRKTFAEFMSDGELTGLIGVYPTITDPRVTGDVHMDWLLHGEAHRVNRLRMTPSVTPVYPPGAVPGSTSASRWIRSSPVLNTVILPDVSDPSQVQAYLTDPRHSYQRLPAGVRVLDLFVCDGPGRWPYDALGQLLSPAEIEARRLYNANAFAGWITPGLININTATPEVMRAMPHMRSLVHEVGALGDNPLSRVAWSILRYRDRLGSPIAWENGPSYAHRGRDQGWFADTSSFDNLNNTMVPGMRGERGFASIGELLLLRQSGRSGKDWDPSEPDRYFYNTTPPTGSSWFDTLDVNSSWRIDYALMPERGIFEFDQYAISQNQATNPYAYLFSAPAPSGFPGFVSQSARLSTDTVEVYDPYNPASTTQGYFPGYHPDTVAEDAPEANLLFAGISNMITTRSDVFTVYFRVRSFRQNPITGRWDATDPEYIVDDSRYVMLVDRSEVNRPTDRPKILYLEKLPK